MDETHQLIARLLTLNVGLACFAILGNVIGLFTLTWYMHKSLRELGETLRDLRR